MNLLRNGLLMTKTGYRRRTDPTEIFPFLCSLLAEFIMPSRRCYELLRLTLSTTFCALSKNSSKSLAGLTMPMFSVLPLMSSKPMRRNSNPSPRKVYEPELRARTQSTRPVSETLGSLLRGCRFASRSSLRCRGTVALVLAVAAVDPVCEAVAMEAVVASIAEQIVVAACTAGVGGTLVADDLGIVPVAPQRSCRRRRRR
jgi:hypothetical protein